MAKKLLVVMFIVVIAALRGFLWYKREEAAKLEQQRKIQYEKNISEIAFHAPEYAAALAYQGEAAAEEVAKKSQENKDRMNARWNQYFRNITSGGWVIIMIVSVLCIGGGLVMKKIRNR